LIDIEYHSVIY